MQQWSHIHAIEWLSWNELASVTACNRAVRAAICKSGGSVLHLSDGKLSVKRGHLTRAELKGLQAVEGSWSGEDKENLVNHLGRYFEASPVGKALFKRSFRIWPSPMGSIAGSLMCDHPHAHMGVLRVPASCVEDCSEAWVTRRSLVYVQDGYCNQGLWTGVLQLTTVADWKKEPGSFRLIMQYGHNLDYSIHSTMHLRPNLVMCKLPRHLLGLSVAASWKSPILHRTAPMPERRAEEPPFRKYCLDRWKEVAVDRVDWIRQDRTVHDFTREALMDDRFPWDGDFGVIWKHLEEGQAEFEAKRAFVNSWRRAGLEPQEFCLDCKAWVRHTHEDSWEEEDEEEDEIIHKNLRVDVYGCWVVSALTIDDFRSDLSSDEENLEDKVLREYGANTALFGSNVSQSLVKPKRSPKRTRARAQWLYDESRQCWKLHGHRYAGDRGVRWKKTCSASGRLPHPHHFPTRGGQIDVENPKEP